MRYPHRLRRVRNCAIRGPRGRATESQPFVSVQKKRGARAADTPFGIVSETAQPFVFAHRALPGQLRIMRTDGASVIVAGGFTAPPGHCTEIAIDDALLS